MKSILSRRSIRKYTSQAVDKDKIEQLLRAAMAAPSAGNEQPWHFVVIRDRELLSTLGRVHPYAKMLDHAPLAILCVGDPSLEKYPGNWSLDCSAATENILLAANDLGLGGVWLGVYPQMDRCASIGQVLGIPQDKVPFSLLALGYPDEEKGPADRYNAERVRYDRW